MLRAEIHIGLTKNLIKRLQRTGENEDVIREYIRCLQNEIRLSQSYRILTATVLIYLSEFSNHKKLNDMTKEDILTFLGSLRKSEEADPLHCWISTYNTYLVVVQRFFKWLYQPDMSPKQRPKPSCIEIASLKRLEKSIYKPTDLWTQDDDLLFLKYCPSKRDRCHHAISRDSSCRPHELLKLRIKDVVFKMVGQRQYAEILVNGKTGQRNVPLINSIPYLKEWIEDHPQAGNLDSILICGFTKSLGRSIMIQSLNKIYQTYKKKFFPKLLQNPNFPSEDKAKITELLRKPWNPYIRRHSALTEKSEILKDHTLRQHAGWSPTSSTHQKYIHYFGNESSESILEAYGLKSKSEEVDRLRPRQCPNCNEANKLDSKFCAKCRMVLTYDGYSEIIEDKEHKQCEVKALAEKYEKDMKELKTQTDEKLDRISCQDFSWRKKITTRQS